MLFSFLEFVKFMLCIVCMMCELLQMEVYYEVYLDELFIGEWGVLVVIFLGIYNVYNGIEDIFFSIVKDVDDYVLIGSFVYQDIFDQMVLEIVGIWFVFLNSEFYDIFLEIKGFCYFVCYRYGFDLKFDRVVVNFKFVRDVFFVFVEVVIKFEGIMSKDGD